jgi:hypothetical protein
MTESNVVSNEQLIDLCREHIAAQSQPEQDPDHEGWSPYTALVITPRMVADILAANNEI